MTRSISADVRDRLHWLPVKQRIKFKIKCVLVFKCKINEAPAYLSEMLHRVVCLVRYNFRSDTRLDCDMFLRSLQALVVLLLPVRHSGIVYRTGKLSQRLCVVECFQGRTRNIFIQESSNWDSRNCELHSSWLV